MALDLNTRAYYEEVNMQLANLAIGMLEGTVQCRGITVQYGVSGFREFVLELVDVQTPTPPSRYGPLLRRS